MNFKNHIHTKIRNLFSSWLLPARRIHIEFIIESDKVPMPEVAKRIGIEQCEVRTTFPKNSIAKPYWQVDVKSNDISIEDPLRVLINLLEPKTGVIKEVLAESGKLPYLASILSQNGLTDPYWSCLTMCCNSLRSLTRT